jgi:hypothetical protein
MASIIREIEIDAPADHCWDALADFGAVHERIAPGFLVDARMEDATTRTVTFFTGAVARERLVGLDHEHRRLAYSVVESSLGATHHNASAQVVPIDARRSRFVWTTDVLPDALADVIAMLMDQGILVIKRTLACNGSGARSPRA